MTPWYWLRIFTEVVTIFAMSAMISVCYWQVKKGRKDASRYIPGLFLGGCGATLLLARDLLLISRGVLDLARWGGITLVVIGLFLVEREWRRGTGRHKKSEPQQT